MSFLAPMLPALLPIAGQAIGGLLGGGGGGTPQVSAPSIQTALPGFQSGGLTTGYNPSGMATVTPSGLRTDLVGGLSQTFGQQANDIGNLRNQFAPGFSALRQAQMATLNNMRTSSIGNLRDNLARRRILGSSFAQDSLARADQDYANTAANINAQTYLQELSANQQLIQQQYTAARGQFTTQLDELNLEAGIAAKLTSSATDALNSAAKTQAELDLKASTTNADLQSKSSAAAGKFFGGIGQQLGTAVGKFFSGGSSLDSSIPSLAGATEAFA